jgi:DNA polymerase-3 subunit beta
MRLSIDKPSLVKALAHVASVVERRNTIPILSNVLLSAAKNELKLTATDLDIELVETVPCKAKGEGATTVPAHMFHDIVRKLPDGSDIELTRDGEQGRLTIACGPARFSLQTLPADDFPSLSVEDLGHSFSLAAKDLRRLIEKTKFAISTEETRYYLNGIYLHETKSDGKALLRRQGHARRDRTAKDRGGAFQARRGFRRRHPHRAFGRQDPHHRPARGAHLEADRRHFP